MRCFCKEGICTPEKNYMVDMKEKAKQIIRLIDGGKYFCINRARQFGKTNMLFQLAQQMNRTYYVFYTSFQSASREDFSSTPSFLKFFIGIIRKCMERSRCPENMIANWLDLSPVKTGQREMNFDFLREKIDRLCSIADRGIVLMIDEVDSAGDNDIFIKFLGTLRDNYQLSGMKLETSFQSVILAGVTDIRNLKAKIRPEETHRSNSPWNIAAEFKVDMSFSEKEIAGMLQQYEADYQTGMDIQGISQELRRLTSGYPFIVSWLCDWLDVEGDMNWTVEGVRAAGRAFVRSDCTLIDDLQKNLDNNPDLKEMLINILYHGASYTLKPFRRPVQLGIMYGYLKDDGSNCAKVTNLLFEEYLYEYSVAVMRDSMMSRPAEERSQFIQGSHLNVVQILNRFQAFLTSEYRSEDSRFVEKQGRLLFLCFLKPIINGTGNYYVEPQTRSSRRMDVVISYGNEEHIVELKIWDGPKYRQEGIRQLEDYMDSRKARTGYLLSFNFQKTDRTRSGWLSPEETGRQIYELIIQCTAEAQERPV